MAYRNVRDALAASVAVCAIMIATPACAQSKTFNVPAQSAATGIPELARQADIQILVSESAVRGKRTKAVRGTMTAEQALRRLIAGTGLRIVSGDGRTYTLSGAAAEDELPNESQSASSTGESDTSDNTIVVTGTNIRGLRNNTAPTTTYEREDLDRTGYTTTQAFVENLPQNFKGGDAGLSADGIVGISPNGLSNIEGATGVNLRGLGSSSTLVLLNGHRIAAAAFGSAVDVSLIPFNAIERVDVLTDGASAVYGSDAVGGVVNFVLRKDYEGAETSVELGTVTSGNYRQAILGQTLGTSWVGGNILGAVQYEAQSKLYSEDRESTIDAPRPTDLYPKKNRLSIMLAGQQQIGQFLTFSGDLFYTHDRQEREYTNSSSGYTFYGLKSNSLSLRGELRWDVSPKWHVSLSGVYSRLRSVQREVIGDPLYVPCTFADGELVCYENGDPYLRNRFVTKEGNLQIDGELFELPGGGVKIALGGSYRKESFSNLIYYSDFERSFSRGITAGFAELYVPIFGETNAVPLFNRLEFSSAVRVDRYSDVGTTTNPKFGLYWSPSQGIGIRAAYGTSFRTPNASDNFAASGTRVIFRSSGYALPGGGTGDVFSVYSPSPLVPEESKTFSAGIDIAPVSVPGLNLSFNYYHTDYTNRLTNAPSDYSALLKPEVYGSLITSIADDAAGAAFIAGLVSQGYLYLDFTGTGQGTSGVRYSLPFGIINAARLVTSGVDARANYSFTVGHDSFNLGVNATHINKMDTSFCGTCSPTDVVNTFGQPLRLRLRGDVGWRRDEVSINAAINYANGYTNTRVVPVVPIDSYTTVDLNVRYQPKQVRGLTVGVSALNIFDAKPPYAFSRIDNVNYDVTNANILGRFVSLQIRKEW